MNKKCLITGSGGFIFSNFIRKAIYEKFPYTFVSLDNVSKNSVLNNIYTNKHHQFYIGDATDKHFINIIFELERPDIVIHAAAETFVDDSIINSSKFINTNVLGTQVIIDACVKWNVNTLMYISTDEVYGDLNLTSPSWTEENSINPRNPYSASKAAGELLVKAASNTYGLNYVITRSSNNYGPRQTREKFIPKIIKCINENQKIPVYGKGEQIRDWIHVFDNCSALLTILEKSQFENKGEGQIYNIGANQEFSNLEVVNEVCNAMGKGWDLIEFTKDRPGHDFRYSMDASRLKKLGWQPTFKFKAGIIQTVEWFKNNNWYLR